MNKRRPTKKDLLIGILSVFSLLGVSQDLFGSQKKRYGIEFKGVNNLSQLRSLKDVSSLVEYKKNPPRSLAALKYRAERDIPGFIDVLHGYSFYDACVNTRAFRMPSGKYKMQVFIYKGTPYLLDQFEILHEDPNQNFSYDLTQIKLHDLGLRLHKPALSTKLEEAQKELIHILNQNGYPFAQASPLDITVDQAQKSVAVSLKVKEGEKGYFGKTHIQGSQRVRCRFIKNRIAWKQGSLYNSDKILETEKALYDSGLFSVVTITHGEKLDDQGQLPISIDLIDSKFRNLTLMGNYTTTWEGVGGGATWQNRNLLKTGVDLALNYSINQKVQKTGAELLFPDFLSRKQKLVIRSEVLIQNIQPTFRSKGVDTMLYVERKLSNHFKTSIGTSFNQFRTTDSQHNGFYSLFGIPFNFNTQSSDKVLINPTQGGWGTINFTPYFSLIGKHESFNQTQFEGSFYQFVIPSRKIVIATNAVFGFIFGTDLYDIPPPYRFYAGSPQHLRGYPYQKVSPLNPFGKEDGGKSVFLASIEPRFMILKNLQLVGFFDVGQVYRTTWPQWKTNMLKSLGVGVRFFSFIGPLRLDIGFPLTEIPDSQKHYQIYFSIGQAF